MSAKAAERATADGAITLSAPRRPCCQAVWIRTASGEGIACDTQVAFVALVLCCAAEKLQLPARILAECLA